jgi:hypothetical protein
MPTGLYLTVIFLRCLINALILPAAKGEARALDLPLNTPVRLTSGNDLPFQVQDENL